MESKENKLLFISQEEEIECGLMDMDFILHHVERANRMLGYGETRETMSVHLLWEEGNLAGSRLGLHAALLDSGREDVHVAGGKMIPSNPLNPIERQSPRANALIGLFDSVTGYPLAVMDGTVISNMRTGAGAGLGVKLLANPDASVMGLIGTGVIARYSFEASYRGAKNLKKVKLYDYSVENAKRFVERYSHLNYEFEIVDSAEAAVRDSDIVITATNTNPHKWYIPAEWIKPGAICCPVSCWDFEPDCFKLPNSRYCYDAYYRMEGRSTACAELIMDGVIPRSEVFQTSQILNDGAQCRQSHEDIVWYHTLGICITDFLIGYEIYKKCKEKGLGTEVFQWHNPAMY